MRKKIVAGNWKMNTTVDEGMNLASEIDDYVLDNIDDVKADVILAVPYTHLFVLRALIETENVFIASQNCSEFEKGAYTGEVSVAMLSALGIEYAIIGHSERRQLFGDTSEVILKKMQLLYNNMIMPIFCCGEKLEEREQNNHFNVVEKQIKEVFANISAEQMQNTVIAYEPVWAIGTGKTASPQQAQEMHKHIRNIFAEIYNKQIADDISILYGGSVNAKNAKELFACDDIDGGLVGGASLKADEFITIIKSI